MQNISDYLSPLGKIILTADETGITGLYFDGQRNASLKKGVKYTDSPSASILLAKEWLSEYFSGSIPKFTPPLNIKAESAFEGDVWEYISRIPYGETVSYKEIAAAVAERRGIPRMSSQAVGHAVGKNRISIIIPCHRVIGSDGSLTGYAGGIERKKALLELEGIKIKE